MAHLNPSCTVSIHLSFYSTSREKACCRWVGSKKNLPRQTKLFWQHRHGKEQGTGNLVRVSAITSWKMAVTTSNQDTVILSWCHHYKRQSFILASWWRLWCPKLLYTKNIYSRSVNTFQPLVNVLWITRFSQKAEESLIVVFFQSLVFDSNKAFALAGVCAPISLHQYVKKMSCVRAGLPNTWKTSESRNTRPPRECKMETCSLSELWKLLLCSSWEVLNEQVECNLSRSICGCLSLLNLIPKLLDSPNVINKLQSEL